jgi:hypothetical protein
VYSREIDGKVLTLSASGWTYNRLFVLYDYESESIWYNLPYTNALACVAGPYEGRSLPEIASAYQPWAQWKDAYPDTKFLKKIKVKDGP